MSLFKSISKGFSSLGNAFTGKGGDYYNGIGSALNKLTGSEKAMKDTYKQQMSAMNAQNAYNTMMWNLQNEYNSPSAQLARMADAGIEINPTSYALGTGNLSNTAALVGSDSGFAGSPSPSGNPITALMGMAQGIQGIRESKAREELSNANAKNFASNTANIDQRTRELKNDNDFFEKHGYYPPHGDTPMMSSIDTGPVKKVMDEGWNILKEAHARARARYVKDHPEYNGW